jgi:hypothetical protein
MEASALFLNPSGRVRSGWRLGIFTILLFVVMFLTGTLVRIGYVLAVLIRPQARPGAYSADLVFRFIFLASAVGAGWICNHWLEGLPWRSLGLGFRAHWWQDLCAGSLVGVASLALAAGIAWAAGGLRFAVSGREMYVAVLQTLVSTAVLFTVAALAEEALFRGYPLQTLSRAGLVWLAILLTSLPFAAIHLQNPNVVAGFTFINTALAGVWLAVAYLRTRNLWFPLGVHWAWNWALGSIFGLPVSGITKLAPQPLLLASDHGPAWLTGGNYGIEGGLACTIALLLSTLFIWRTRLVSADAELKILTSQENPVKASVRQT